MKLRIEMSTSCLSKC